MKKQINLHSIKLLSLAIVTAITIIIGATISISAQDKPTFKVGDAVEFYYNDAWNKGEILEVKDYGEYKGIKYRVHFVLDSRSQWNEWLSAEK